MTQYKLNYQLSKEIFGTNRDNFKPNQCYNNTFLLVSNRNIDTNRIKIVYGFIYRKDINIFTRHCFVLHEGEIIDPTAMFWNNVDTLHDTFYYYPIIELNIEEYLNVLDKNRGRIELYNELLNQEIQLHNKLVSRDYHRNFGELGEFLERVYNKDLMKGLNEYKINNGIIKK